MKTLLAMVLENVAYFLIAPHLPRALGHHRFSLYEELENFIKAGLTPIVIEPWRYASVGTGSHPILPKGSDTDRKQF